MNDNERVNSHEPAFPVDVLLKLSGCAAPDSPPAAAAEPPPGMQTTVCSAQKAHHQRAESSITLTPVTLEKYDLDGDGRITRSDLMDILGTLKAQKTGKKVYRGVSLLAGLLLVLVVGVNAILTYVVIQSTRVVTVDENRLVSASASSPQHNAFKGKAPLETAEAMVKFTVASREQKYTPPPAQLLISMKSIMYSDKTSIHKHNVAGVTISGRNATVFSTVPGIAFDFTPKGMYMFRIEDSTGCKTAEQQPQPGSRRSLLADTDTSCWEDTYYDESVDENNEIFLEHFKVEECTSLGGLYSVITYSVLNEAGEWDAEYVDRWFADDIAPIFFDYHDAVGIALMSTTRTGDFNANTNEGAGKDSRNTTEDQHVHLNNTQDITQNGRLDKGAEEGRNAVSMNGFSIGHDEKGTNATVNGDSQGN